MQSSAAELLPIHYGIPTESHPSANLCRFYAVPDGRQCVTWRRHRALKAVEVTGLILIGDKRVFKSSFGILILATLVEHEKFARFIPNSTAVS